MKYITRIVFILTMFAAFNFSVIALNAQEQKPQAQASEQTKTLTKEERTAIINQKIKEAEDALPQSELAAHVDKKTIENMHSLREMRISFIKAVYENHPQTAKFLGQKILGVRVLAISFAVAILLLTWILQGFIVNIIFKILVAIFNKAKLAHINKILEKIRKPMRAFVILIGVSLAYLTVVTNPSAILVAGRIFSSIWIILIFWALVGIVDSIFAILGKKAAAKNNSAKHLVFLLGRIFKYTLIFIAILVMLDHMGVKIGALVASLGIGGAALAFASKDTIANFFGSVSIVADRPFAVGDWVKVGDVEGIVDNVGVRSTRIRTFQKTLVTIPNSVLANESIDNFSKMPTRKAVETIGLTYETTADQIEIIVKDFYEILEKNAGVERDTYMVNFTEFADSSLNIQLVYYTYKTDYASFIKVKEQINLAIMRAVAARGLSMAFPSVSVYMQK